LLQRIVKLISCIFFALLLPVVLKAQDEEDTSHHSRFNVNDIFHQAMESIAHDPNDTLDESALLLDRSEESYKKYEGRYIRYIIISRMGFEKKFSDTSRWLPTVGTRIYNHLHVNTKEWVIQHNLFIREHTPVNAYELADNERYLRTLDFIQDARIIVKPVRGAKDSADVYVFTKDLFTITGDIDASGIQSIKGRAADANFLGMGQRLQFSLLYAQNRKPLLGYEILYRKQSIARTFVTATLAYSQINTGRSDGREEEAAYYFRLERPLVSPYSHFAGALELSRNRSANVYARPDSLFYNYGYNVYDGWIGYNIATTHINDNKNYKGPRDRKFIAVRYLKNHFTQTPLQVGDRFDPIYNSREAILGSLTFFRQDFYKTQYIYGFGTTEDLPYGYNVTATGGWYKQLSLERPYFGLSGNKYIASGAGEFYQVFARTGGFYRGSGTIQDASILLGASVFTRLISYKNIKYRQYARFSYTRLYNRVTYEPLYINNQFGMKDFGTDSVMGHRRINLYAESFLFTKYKVYGFRMAPFVFVTATAITPDDRGFFQSNIYTGLGGGLRTRNENLIFGTIELKATYFPKTAYGVRGFMVALNSGISFRYRTDYVTAPDILRLNADEYVH
jgi:hypothetical protein